MYLAELLVSKELLVSLCDLVTGFWLMPLTLREAQVGHQNLNKDPYMPSPQPALPPTKKQAISPLIPLRVF